ncbi:unnamed protein product, partial [marine sediment metagenome]
MKENIPLQPGEEIRPITGYEGLYSVTSFGRVWSHEKIKRCKNSYGVYKARFLKLQLNRYGYLCIGLHKYNKKKLCTVHRIEAQAFIKNPNNLSEVNHKDGNKQNNYIDNLEWCTDEENHYHASVNKLRYKESSEFYGVYFHIGLDNKKKPWMAQTTKDKKKIYIGSFKTELEAAKAY